MSVGENALSNEFADEELKTIVHYIDAMRKFEREINSSSPQRRSSHERQHHTLEGDRDTVVILCGAHDHGCDGDHCKWIMRVDRESRGNLVKLSA